MATFDEIQMANDAARALSNLSYNMLANAEAYKDFLTRAQAIISGDAANYLKIIGKIEAADQQALAAGLTALGITPSVAVAFKNTLKAAAEAQRDADKTDWAAINTLADAVLAAVPEVKRVF